MNYINEDKNYKTDSEWIKYLEDSIRELRKEKENLKKEKGEIRKRSLELEEENKKLKERIKELEEQRIFSLGEYDYMILTSTTPQLQLIKKNNSDLYSNITVWTTQK